MAGPSDAEAPEGAAASDDASSDDDVVEGELVDAGGEPVPAGGTDDFSKLVDAVLADDAAAAAGIPELTETERLAAERDEYLDALRHLQADFDNFRKRIKRDSQELSTRAVESLVERLLPVLDATDLAVEHAGDEKDATAFAQVASLLWDALAREGLERVQDSGVPFDPIVHDGVAHVPADAEPTGVPAPDGKAADESASEKTTAGEDLSVPMVDAVLRPGFLLRGKVLRPAMVRVKG